MLGALICGCVCGCVLLPGLRGSQHCVHPQSPFPSLAIWPLNHGQQDLCRQPDVMVYVSLLPDLFLSRVTNPLQELVIGRLSQGTKVVTGVAATAETASLKRVVCAAGPCASGSPSEFLTFWPKMMLVSETPFLETYRFLPCHIHQESII